MFHTTEPNLPKNVRLINKDCARVLRKMPDKSIDAIVTDPPYGIGEAASKNKSRGLLATSKDYGDADWDNVPCPQVLIEEMRRVSRWQIIFGGNYFELPPTSCWLVWDKLNGKTDFADCELAWTNLRSAVRRVQYRWQGMLRDGDDERIHPTQKPIDVMVWCLRKLPKDVKTVMDPFMGSGTTGVACAWLGLDFIGVEKDERYFKMAEKRIRLAPRAKR